MREKRKALRAFPTGEKFIRLQKCRLVNSGFEGEFLVVANSPLKRYLSSYEVRQYFSEAEIVKLTMAVIAINSWNRLNVSLRAVPGHYKSQRKPAAEMA